MRSRVALFTLAAACLVWGATRYPVTGIVLDVDYVHTLSGLLREDEEKYRDVAASYGVANVNSTRQIAEALMAMGEVLTETTASGAVKVDKAVLLSLADLDRPKCRLAEGVPLRG